MENSQNIKGKKTKQHFYFVYCLTRNIKGTSASQRSAFWGKVSKFKDNNDIKVY